MIFRLSDLDQSHSRDGEQKIRTGSKKRIKKWSGMGGGARAAVEPRNASLELDKTPYQANLKSRNASQLQDKMSEWLRR